MALIAHAATLESRIPFLHFFDGFRTSHEVNKIEMLIEDDMRAMINMDRVLEHRQRACPRTIRSCAGQRRTRTFSSRSVSRQSFLRGLPGKGAGRDGQICRGRRPPVSPLRLCRRARCRARHRHDGIRRRSGRRKTVEYLNAQGEKVGLLKVRLYPALLSEALSGSPPVNGASRLLCSIEPKKPARVGEPLYLDVVNALHEGPAPAVWCR